MHVKFLPYKKGDKCGEVLLRNRKWFLVGVLAVALPMSLFTMFKFAGVFPEPVKVVETVMVPEVSWECERPMHIIDLDPYYPAAQNVYHEENMFINYSILVHAYNPNVVKFTLYLTAFVKKGFISSANVFFEEDFKPSRVWFWGKAEQGQLTWCNAQIENLTIVEFSQGGQGEKLKAWVRLAGVNKPRSVYLQGIIWWSLTSPYNQSHQLQCTLKLVVCKEKNVGEEIVLPITLKVLPDNNNSFETAEELSFGNHTAYLDAWEDTTPFRDSEDYYKIRVRTDTRIRVAVNSLWRLDLGLYLYDSEQNLIKSSNVEFEPLEQITYTPKKDEILYIRIATNTSMGFYTLLIEET